MPRPPRIPSRPHAKAQGLDTRRERALERARQRDYSLLEAYCRELLRKGQDPVFAHVNLAVVEADVGRMHKAVEHAQTAIRLDSSHGLAYSNLAMYLAELRRWPEAKAAAERATELMPRHASAWLNLSWACNALSLIHEGEMAARRALELAPDMPKALNNLANSFNAQGRPAEAVSLYRKILEREPDNTLTMSNLLLSLQYDERASTLQISATAHEAGAQFMRLANGERVSVAADPDPARRIRVGFLSPDLSNHAVMYFLEPLLCGLDRERFEVHAFYLYAEGDHVTERCTRFVDHLHMLGGMKPRQQAEYVAGQRIDVLMDLAGHTARTGLPAMAYKPAPVQGTWLGYPGTTGLETIDFRITDAVADAQAAPGEYAEALRPLPGPFCVYRPMIRYPLRRYWGDYGVRPTPALANGYITFGSCNNIAKLSAETLRVWGELLQRLPTARLLVEGKGLDHPELGSAFRTRCADAGIDVERLELVQRDTNHQYLLYQRIDIALDPFPLTGGTTTADVLWFGVPMVSMRGRSYRERLSTTLLQAAGRTEWVADEPSKYLDIAVGLAADVRALDTIRAGLRRQVERSPIMDEAAFAVQFGDALRTAWVEWCVSQGATAPTVLPPMRANRDVFLAPGKRVDVASVYADLNHALVAGNWPEVARLATLVLESRPLDHGALAALAEVEWARQGHQRALDYLVAALNQPSATENYFARLSYWLDTLGRGQEAAAIRRTQAQRFGSGTTAKQGVVA